MSIGLLLVILLTAYFVATWKGAQNIIIGGLLLIIVYYCSDTVKSSLADEAKWLSNLSIDKVERILDIKIESEDFTYDNMKQQLK